MDDKVEGCINHSFATGSVVVVVATISVVTNITAIIRLHNASLKKTAVLCLKLLSGMSIILASMTTACTCLALFTCYLDNTTTCVLQGVILRLTRTTIYFLLTMLYVDTLCQYLVHHPQRHTVKMSLLLFAVAWILSAVMLELPLFPATTYHEYPGLFACDIEDARILVTSDSLVFCVPAFAVMAIGVGILVTESNSQLSHRISYVVTRVQGEPCLDQVNRITKKFANAGLVISLGIILEWMLRVIAVLGSDYLSSRSLFTMTLFLMLIFSMCVPASLLLLSQPPSLPTDSVQSPSNSQSQNRGNASTQQETSFNRKGSMAVSCAATPSAIMTNTAMYSEVPCSSPIRSTVPDINEDTVTLDIPTHHGNLRNSVSCDRSVGTWIVNRHRY